ncbi:hypothetical protein JCM17960_07750 [Magnetospira thiophila]
MQVKRSLILGGASMALFAVLVLVGFATHDLWKDGIGNTRAKRPPLAQEALAPSISALPGETGGMPRFQIDPDPQPQAQSQTAAFPLDPQPFANVQPSPIVPQLAVPEQPPQAAAEPAQGGPQPWQRRTTAGGAALQGDVRPTQMVDAGQPTVPNYLPQNVLPYEVHWQGLDARQFTTELARKLQFPMWMEGLLVGEVTMNAAASGMLGGDVIVQLEDTPITNLVELHDQSRILEKKKSVKISVFRKRKKMVGNEYAMRRLTFVMHGNPTVGLAQLEGAPMIMPGDPRPHSYRGPCTDCHNIGSGFELTPDPDLITLPPPPILQDVALRKAQPHEDRGPCEACHVIQ